MALITLTIAAAAQTTPRSRLLALDLGGLSFSFAAGQAVLMGPHGGTRRPYSLASGPSRVAESGRLELLIATDPGADMSWAAPGARVDVEGPMGSFTYDAAPVEPDVLFVAGGVGIAPLRAMLQEALAHEPAPRIAVLYSARRRDEFAFIEELSGYAARNLIRLHQTVTREQDGEWQGPRGRIGRGEFEQMLSSPASTTCFVCGPSAFVDDTVRMLTALGVPDAHVRIEQWGR